MSKKLLFLTIIFFSITAKAQVGVKTENPQGVFHIDGQGNTSGNTNISDDVVVTAAGNVGIGTNDPQTKVDILTTTESGGFRLRDGSQGNGKILTTDGNGYASWKVPGVAYAKLGNIPTSSVTNPVLAITAENMHMAYSGMSIELTPGDYQVNFTVYTGPVGDAAIFTTTSNRFASIFFSTSNTTNTPPAYLSPIKSVIISGLYNNSSNANTYYGSGSIPIRITSTTTLYLWIYMSSNNWTGNDRKIISANQSPGDFGPYVQLYAIPFYVE